VRFYPHALLTQRWWPLRRSFVIKSRPATLAEVIPGAPARCSYCDRIVGTNFTAFHLSLEDPRVVGWHCNSCGGYHSILTTGGNT
jgi:hypothetical protein